MKLYVWEAVGCDWTCGIAVAAADTVEDARKAIAAEAAAGGRAWLHWIEKDVAGPPDRVHDLDAGPAAAVCAGGG